MRLEIDVSLSPWHVTFHKDPPSLDDGELTAMLANIADSLLSLRTQIMKTQSQLTAELTAIGNQLTKIGTESSTTLQKVADLEAAIAAQTGGAEVTPELEAAVAALKTQVQVVDDLVSDITPPAGETPA
jgi:flagellar hook-basal body complex protein FliE